MDRVRRIRQFRVDVPEVGKVGREGVSVPEQSVLLVDCTDRVVHPDVKLDYARMRGIRGLVERVVSRDPLVIFVVLRELGPQPEDTVLEIFVIPN